jgi:hypothetical protein
MKITMLKNVRVKTVMFIFNTVLICSICGCNSGPSLDKKDQDEQGIVYPLPLDL